MTQQHAELIVGEFLAKVEGRESEWANLFGALGLANIVYGEQRELDRTDFGRIAQRIATRIDELKDAMYAEMKAECPRCGLSREAGFGDNGCERCGT